MVGGVIREREALEEFRQENIPVAIYELTCHLLDSGRRRIAFISRPLAKLDTTRRFEGYLQALKDRGLAQDPELHVETNCTLEGGYKAMELLLSLRSRPDAVFAYNDVMAIGALNALNAHGIQVPDEIALVGFDDIDAASYTYPPLTTVALPKKEMGEWAVETILRTIDKGETPKKVILPTRVVIRQSCGWKKKPNMAVVGQ